jgi:hypothetical protein
MAWCLVKYRDNFTFTAKVEFTRYLLPDAQDFDQKLPIPRETTVGYLGREYRVQVPAIQMEVHFTQGLHAELKRS